MSAMLTLGKLLPLSLTNLCTIIFQTIHFKNSYSSSVTTFPLWKQLSDHPSADSIPLQDTKGDETQPLSGVGDVPPRVWNSAGSLTIFSDILSQSRFHLIWLQVSAELCISASHPRLCSHSWQSAGVLSSFREQFIWSTLAVYFSWHASHLKRA